MVIPPNTSYSISPDHSSTIPMPTLSAMTLQDRYPSSPRASIPDPLFAHPTSTFAPPPPHHTHPLVFLPFSAEPTMHVHDCRVPQSTFGHHPWYPTVSVVPTPQMPHLEAPAHNTEAREGTVAWASAPIPINEGTSTYAHSTPQTMSHPMTRSRVTTHPYTRVSFRKKTRPVADYTPDLALVQAHCIADGGDPAAISLLQTVFADGILTNTLTRHMTRDEARKYNHGVPSQVYRVFLRADDGKRFHCRLCASDADEGGWRYAKDALRHLKRDHFGLGTRSITH